MANESGAASTAKQSQFEREFESLKSDMNKIKEDLRKMADSAVSTAQSSARSMKAQAEGRFDEGKETVEQYIERRPMTSIAIAFGVGVLVSKIFDSK